MELDLRLGTGNGPPFGFYQKPQDPTTVSHRGLDFCLTFSSNNIPPLDPQQQQQQHEQQQTHNHKPNQQHQNNNVVNVARLFQLDLLPRTPLLLSPPSSQTDISEAAGGFTDVISSAPPSAEVGKKISGGGLELEEGNNRERGWWRGSTDEEDQNMGSRKKLRLSREQSAFLEESFKEHHTLYPKQKLELARRLNLRPRQVEVWFQNRRARTKLKQTEVDCEYLKKCCETLSQENRKLQKELKDLRALKTTDSLKMHYLPPTTLTMCPSCLRAAKHPIV